MCSILLSILQDISTYSLPTHYGLGFLIRAPVQQQVDGLYMTKRGRIVERSEAILHGEVVRGFL